MAVVNIYKAILFRQTSGTKLGQVQAVTGWTSVWYVNGNSLAEAGATAANLNVAEMKSYAEKVTCFGIRISDVRNPRLFEIAAPGTGGDKGAIAGGISGDPNYALRIKCRTAEEPFAWHYLRGFPYAVFDSSMPAAFLATAATDASLQQLADAIKANATHVQKSQLSDPNYTGQAYQFVDFPTSTGTVQSSSIRRSGRPFGLRHGRRLVV